jgi:hypothetical protein
MAEIYWSLSVANIRNLQNQGLRNYRAVLAENHSARFFVLVLQLDINTFSKTRVEFILTESSVVFSPVITIRKRMVYYFMCLNRYCGVNVPFR